MDVITLAKQSIKGHEGEVKRNGRHVAYDCTAEKTTVAYGRNLDDRGLSDTEAEILLDNDIVECIQYLATFSYWNRLSPSQQAALIDLRFCLGPSRFRSFRLMDQALMAGDYPQAAHEVLHSKFADQTGKRAADIAQMLVIT